MNHKPSERAIRIAEKIACRTTVDHYRLVLNEERKPLIAGSKIGGKPYWPVGKDYPVDVRGKQMLMVMQVNCEEADLKAPLPEKGLLQWFISIDPELMYGCRGNFDADRAGFTICYHSEVIEDLSPIVVPTSDSVDERLTPVKREVAIDVIPEKTAMNVSDGHFNNLFFEIVKEITGVKHEDKMWYEYLDNDDCLYFEQQLGMKRPSHQMLGYPVYTQAEARRNIDAYDTLLFQLDSQFSKSDNRELVMWGDMGSGFIFMNQGDMMACDFSHPYYCWDCG